MRGLVVRFLIGRIGAHRLLAEFHRTFKEPLPVVTGHNVVAVYRERLRRQGVSPGGPEGFRQVRGLEKTAFLESGPCIVDRLGVRT